MQDYFSANPFPSGGPYSIYITATTEANLTADACEPLPPNTPDLSKFVVLTKRESCPINSKIKNLEKAGAKLILYRSICKYSLTAGSTIQRTAVLFR